MISKKELQEFARLKGLNLGNAEKDYLIDIALLSISKHTKNELVFKGGTCLYKFHKLNRFSEDIDFSAVSEVDVNSLINRVVSDFDRFGIKARQHQKKELYNSVLATLRIEGPLFSGKPATYASLGIDINLKSFAVLEPELLEYDPIYPDIPKVPAFCMRQEEIFAEKIRALMTRERARDLFDLHFLIKKNVHASKDIIAKKMEYYNETFELGKLILRIKSLEKLWKQELAGFTSEIPDFGIISKKVAESLKKYYT